MVMCAKIIAMIRDAVNMYMSYMGMYRRFAKLS